MFGLRMEVAHGDHSLSFLFYAAEAASLGRLFTASLCDCLGPGALAMGRLYSQQAFGRQIDPFLLLQELGAQDTCNILWSAAILKVVHALQQSRGIILIQRSTHSAGGLTWFSTCMMVRDCGADVHSDMLG